MTRPQHMEALQLANETRLARSAVRCDVAEGIASVAMVLDESCCQTASLFEVLCWQHGWGRARALAALGELGISESRTIGELTARQQEEIRAVVENPTHTAHGIGLAHFDMERLGFEEGEEILPGITIHADSGVTGNFRVLCDGEHDGERRAEAEVTRAVGVEA